MKRSYESPSINLNPVQYYIAQTQNYLTFEIPPGTYDGTFSFLQTGTCQVPGLTQPFSIIVTQDPNDPGKGSVSTLFGGVPVEGVSNDGDFEGSFTLSQMPWGSDNAPGGDNESPCLALNVVLSLSGTFTGNQVSATGDAIVSQIVDNPADTDETCDLNSPPQPQLPCDIDLALEGTRV
jgi:hypothetical protein